VLKGDPEEGLKTNPPEYRRLLIKSMMKIVYFFNVISPLQAAG
jgi:hypothetical protein